MTGSDWLPPLRSRGWLTGPDPKEPADNQDSTAESGHWTSTATAMNQRERLVVQGPGLTQAHLWESRDHRPERDPRHRGSRLQAALDEFSPEGPRVLAARRLGLCVLFWHVCTCCERTPSFGGRDQRSCSYSGSVSGAWTVRLAFFPAVNNRNIELITGAGFSPVGDDPKAPVDGQHSSAGVLQPERSLPR